ncbi:MAG: hypothetical protein QUS09_05620 [Methanotrichaceae archaeon]|nr:hypothetical protein [Methanotrichaceae archaeon]
MAVSSSVAATADGAAISQNAALAGKFGSVGLIADSKQNQMAVAGSFSGESGYMNADLSAVAAGWAAMAGSALFEGMEVLNNDHLARVASGDIAMSVDGLYAQPSGELGRFSLDTANIESAAPRAESSVSYATADNPNAYVLGGWRWNSIALGQKKDGIKFYVKDDANLRSKGLDPALTAAAVGRAAETWDSVTSKNLFSDSGVTATGYMTLTTRSIPMTERTWQDGSISLQRPTL